MTNVIQNNDFLDVSVESSRCQLLKLVDVLNVVFYCLDLQVHMQVRTMTS